MFGLILIGLAALALDLAVSGFSLQWLAISGLVVFSALVSSPVVFSRRAQVGGRSFVAPILPFPDRFLPRTSLVSLDEVSEIYNLLAGARLVGLAFETRDGKKYFVFRGLVGKEVFEHFLDLKRRFYTEGYRDSS